MPQAPDQHSYLLPLSLRLGRVVSSRAVRAVPLTLWTTSLAAMEPADTLAPHRWLAARLLGDSAMGMAAPCGSSMD